MQMNSGKNSDIKQPEDEKSTSSQNKSSIAHINGRYDCNIETISIKISKKWTNTIHSLIQENIDNIYAYMMKSLPMVEKYIKFFVVKNNRIGIINFDFHCEKSNKILYTTITQIKNDSTYKFEMNNTLVTEDEIKNVYDIDLNKLPLSSKTIEQHVATQTAQRILHSFSSSKALQLIFHNEKFKWHKIRILARRSSEKELTLSLTKQELLKSFREYFKQFELNKMKLIPIAMFNKTDYWIEHILIVRLQDNIDIGISFMYNETFENNMRVNGIHLDKQYIKSQHMLVNPNHDCHCLDGFNSCITRLKIGNVSNMKSDVALKQNDDYSDVMYRFRLTPTLDQQMKMANHSDDRWWSMGFVFRSTLYNNKHNKDCKMLCKLMRIDIENNSNIDSKNSIIYDSDTDVFVLSQMDVESFSLFKQWISTNSLDFYCAHYVDLGILTRTDRACMFYGFREFSKVLKTNITKNVMYLDRI
eukprot:190886_1